ncbi:MAG: hypothetical protein RRZ66_12110 [Bacteroidales bacterium]
MYEILFYKELYTPLQNRFKGLSELLRSTFQYKSSNPFSLTIPRPSIGEKEFIFNGCHLSNLTLIGYQPQKIVCGQLNSTSHYGVSFEFTGCAMARFLDYSNNPYICHIYLSGDSADCKILWKEFIDKCGYDLIYMTIFKPYTPTIKKLYEYICKSEIFRTTVCGVICPNGDCYSLLMRSDDFWIIYCEKVTPLYKSQFVASYIDKEAVKNAVDRRLV